MRDAPFRGKHLATLAATLTLLTGCASTLPAGPPQFSFELPRGSSFGTTAIIVSKEAEAEDGASVLGRTPGSFGAITCAGDRCEETELERRSTAGAIRSSGSVELERGAHVAGDVATEGRVHVARDARIDGTTTSNSTQLRPPQVLSWTSELPPPGLENVRIDGGQTRALAPASYGKVDVEHGTLELTAGTYSFRSLEIERGSTLRILHKGQAVIVYVGHELEHDGLTDDGGDSTHLLFAVSGRHDVEFEGPLRATVVAPRAAIELEELRGSDEHRGMVIGRKASLGEGTTLRHVLFAHWGLFFQPRPVLECVSEFTATAFAAILGYDNELDIPLGVPHGPRNRLEPSGDGIPPEVFAPGRNIGVFTTTLPASGVGYRLGSNVAAATRASLPRCTDKEYRNLPGRVPPGIVDPARPGPWDPNALARSKK